MSNKQNHKRWRKQFNENCLNRDKHKCVFCNVTENLDVHHITDRHVMPNGGYAMSNGITVCEEHHLKCEEFHMNDGKCDPEYHPMLLYQKIGSSYEKAYHESEGLK
jgi:5-methylcytosine-specific restriction endonuclease McrA